ncbi:hypothetical protein [Ruminococcus albus]|uniref:Uncharacterized protein n=1 Tax=Ruminococcus albus TaxID=1264 RepID=A0A1I1NL86_RUMAL|nr:hypothetical protein [Ruminococcus albus]SFC94510.1 hypothetical protein SAMN02910406_02725 [Ruminococcus albus]
MKELLSNIWVKRAVGVFNLVYFAVIGLLTFATFLYDLEFTEGQEQSFFTVYVAASVIFLLLMIYSREVMVTKIISVVMPFIVFLLLLFNMYDWILVIPPLVMGIVMFFVAGTHETVKVVMGTIYLLIYVLGLVAFFVFKILFGGTSTLTELNANLDRNSAVYSFYKKEFTRICDVTRDENVISPDGKYRIILYDVQNSDKGGVNICVVPNCDDVKLRFFTLKQKGVKKTISNKGIRGTVPDVGWDKDEDGTLVVYYRLAPESERKKTSVTVMPKKQYLEFLGIS